MKTPLPIIIILILIHLNFSLYSEESSVTENTKMDIIEFCIISSWNLKQRKQALKKFVRQEFRNGIPLREIRNKLQKLAENAKEMEAYRQSEKIVRKTRSELTKNKCVENSWCYDDDKRNVIDTPACKLIEQNYINEQEKYKKLKKIAENIPERTIEKKLSIILSIEEDIPYLLQSKRDTEKGIENTLQQKEKIEKRIQEFSESVKEKEFLNSL